MWISRLLILLSVLALPACGSKAETPRAQSLAPRVPAQPYDVARERSVIYDQVREAIAKKDFPALNRMERDFRTRRARTSGGTWKLADFYAGVVFYLKPKKIDGQCRYDAAPFVASWAAAAPEEPAAHIAGAELLLVYGWCFRGDGTVEKVSLLSWPLFHAQVNAAFKALDSARQAAIDPEYYAAMEEIYLYKGHGKAEFQQLLDTAVAREPYYYSLYFNAFRYYQPQWMGSDQEADALAHYAVEHTKQEDGLGAYARVYWYATECNCRLDYTGVDKALMKVAMRDVITRYPSDWNAANFAKIACRFGDGKDAAGYLGMLHDDDGSLWEDKQEWRACRMIADYASRPQAPRQVEPTDPMPGTHARTAARCPWAAREQWSAADIDTYCRQPRGGKS